ncbi:hypothetical protein FHS57_005125 [Runella defluvii]|uniref:Uncharacterized protein n=1 Tax=Runella defluvii TaxID=370973 RepID=A0A7W5ZQA7_9BACT|nr:hypothetical protein [Runella defluvii]MBB3841104.1 hypothetical protein [Runella defluvii]
MKKGLYWWEYEDASGLQRGQLWQRLTQAEQAEIVRLNGYRKRKKIPNAALEYLKSVFPLPIDRRDLLSMSEYERRCGFGKGEVLKLLSDEQREHLVNLGYRRSQKLTYRAMLYLKSLGYY